MEVARRWSVTYTKHVKQKRKVYQDGFLEHQPSRHKVLLYDEWDKLLESKFVKKEDVIKSGETLTSDSYLVDIGELCGGHKPTSIVNSLEKMEKVSEKKPGSLHRFGSQTKSSPADRKPLFGKTRGRPINLSPSAKLIRDFKKSEASKCVSSPNCMDMTKTTTTEWQVLYTTQLTQKAKKFHDGFLQLVVRGSQGRQVKLFDTNRRQLDGKFLKKDEIVRSCESLLFEGHLVEIGELEGDHKPVIDLTHQGKICKIVGKSDVVNHPAKIPTNKNFPDNKTSPGKLTVLSDLSVKVENTNLSWCNNEPKRADSVERFHISAYVLFVLAQNILEAEGPWLGSFLSNALVVFICEVMIDIIKHSFIAKFNDIKPIAFSEFLEDLCMQKLNMKTENGKSLLTFVPLAPACVVIRVLRPVYAAHLPYNPLAWRVFWILVLLAMTFVMLASLKVLIGMGLQKHAMWYVKRCETRKFHSD